MSHDNEPVDKAVVAPLTDEELQFLRDEGLDLLALFRGIRERAKRDLIVELVRAISEGQPATNGA